MALAQDGFYICEKDGVVAKATDTVRTDWRKLEQRPRQSNEDGLGLGDRCGRGGEKNVCKEAFTASGIWKKWVNGHQLLSSIGVTYSSTLGCKTKA